MGVFYTKTGDDGYTGIIGEGRVAKYDPRLEAMGALDEANAALGFARASIKSEVSTTTILKVQRDLYLLMAEIAASGEVVELFKKVDDGMVSWLENQIDAISGRVTMPNQFIVPGDCLAGAAMDVARTTVRRAERRVAELLHLGQIQNDSLLRYINRLSSLCFVLEIYENQADGAHPLTFSKTKDGP